MNLAAIRRQFPILTPPKKGQPPIYFDNACMSLRPEPVIEAITAYYTKQSACAGRSNHRLAAAVSAAVSASRQKVQYFLHAKSADEIIFTRNTTEGLNLVAASLGLKAGDCVITTDKEHNSNLVPWLKLSRTVGIKHQVIRSLPDNQFDLDAYAQFLHQHQVKLVSVVHTSNLDGVTNPLPAIISLAHQAGAKVLVDAAQSAPHLPINVQALDVDFLAFSSHKLCGPSGMGVLYGKKALLETLDGFIVGGDTVEYTTYTSYAHLPQPEKFEAGLQDYAGIIGTGAAIDFLNQVGFDFIKQQELQLNTRLTEGLQGLPHLHLIGPADPAKRAGIVAFYLDQIAAHQVSLLLDQSYGIMVRSGQHCVHSWFHDRQLAGSVRASLYFYNTLDEVELFLKALQNVLQVLS